MSGRIQNEIIEATKMMLHELLVEKVNSALCWTMLADETTDNARDELLAPGSMFEVYLSTLTVKENQCCEKR
jgi:hypothetical protein